jgi:hypothetical protein
MIRCALAMMGVVLLASSGCLIVNPSEVSLTASPAPLIVTTPEPSEPQTAYGPALTRVIRQQDKVVAALNECDWEDVIDEAGDWTEYVRVLSGYADTTHDRALFRECCDQLLSQIKQIRDSAIRRDFVRCQAAIRSSDPILDKLGREFPVTRAAAAIRRAERRSGDHSGSPRMP